MLQDGMKQGQGLSPSVSRPMTPRFLKVRRLIREMSDTVTLEFSDPESLSGFTPGQFNMLYAFGAGEAAISISGDPGNPSSLVHTVRRVGIVTTTLTAARRGASIGIRGPYGRGWPVDEAARRGSNMLLLAGGIGLAPLRPVIYHFLSNREKFGRLTLLYGARTPADLLFAREFEKWRGQPRLKMQTIVDRGDRSWQGQVGALTDLLHAARFDPADTVAMICGPEVMMRVVADELMRRGVAPDDVHLAVERNMKCAIGTCGHCQFGPSFVCKDGPVFALPRIAPILGIREI